MTSFASRLLGISAVLAFLAAQAAPSPSDITQFDFGFNHRCAVTRGGAVQCSGMNNRGQIGNGEAGGIANRPRQVIARGATAVSAGELYTCAVVDGAVLCWGLNLSAEIGIGKTGEPVLRPRKIIDQGATTVSTGGHHACAVVGGRLLCWGANNVRQASSDPQAYDVLLPKEIFAAGVTAVSAGQWHTCAIVDGALLCWGSNTYGEVGVGAAEYSKSAPLQVIASGVTAVSAGAGYTCAVVRGSLQCWGSNSHGQLGIGMIGGKVLSPRQVIASGVTAVSTGDRHTCAIVNGGLQCWGDNSSGQLGIDTSGAAVLAPRRVIAGGVSAVDVTGLTGGGIVGTCAMVDAKLLCSRNNGFDGIDTPFGISGEESRVGVWKGTIGGQKVVACFDRSFDSSYYYLRHFTGIPLQPLDKMKLAWAEGREEKAWAEGREVKATATWQLKAVAEDRLEGEWSDVATARRLPILLTRAYSDKDENGGCSMDSAQAAAFNAPRVDAQKIAKGKAKFNEDNYLSLSTLADAIQGIEFPGNNPRFTVVNAMLGIKFRNEIQAYFECQLMSGIGPPDYRFEMRIQYLDKNWLSIEEITGGDCGGAHPFYGFGFRNIDLARGREVNLWTWFEHARKVDAMPQFDIYYVNYAAPAELNDLVLSYIGVSGITGDECGDAVRENREYELSLGQKGILFSTVFPHVIQACNERGEVPFPRLLPFMNEKGKEAVRLIVAAP